MQDFENNAYFWQKVDTLYQVGDFKLVHKKGSSHDVYPALIYPCNCGYIADLSSEQSPMEVFKGEGGGSKVEAIALCADIVKKSFEIKALVGLSDEEIEEVLHFLNCTDFQKSVLIKRGKKIPSWGETE